jgi:hypothetical protein
MLHGRNGRDGHPLYGWDGHRLGSPLEGGGPKGRGVWTLATLPKATPPDRFSAVTPLKGGPKTALLPVHMVYAVHRVHTVHRILPSCHFPGGAS